MQVGIYTGRNKLSHIKDFKLKCSLLCHFVINRFVKSGKTYKAVDIDLHLKRMAENEHGATFPVGPPRGSSHKADPDQSGLRHVRACSLADTCRANQKADPKPWKLVSSLSFFLPEVVAVPREIRSSSAAT